MLNNIFLVDSVFDIDLTKLQFKIMCFYNLVSKIHEYNITNLLLRSEFDKGP